MPVPSYENQFTLPISDLDAGHDLQILANVNTCKHSDEKKTGFLSGDSVTGILLMIH